MSKIDKEVLVVLLNSGLTQVECGKYFNCTREAVRQMIAHIGYDYKSQGDRIILEHDKLKNNKEIAEAVRCTVNAVQSKLWRSNRKSVMVQDRVKVLYNIGLDDKDIARRLDMSIQNVVNTRLRNGLRRRA
jgi:hypothetical protein